MVVRALLKLWLLVREWNKGDNSNLVSAVPYLDTGKYPAWICGYLTHPKANLAVVLRMVLIGPIGHRNQRHRKVAHVCDVWEHGAFWRSWLG
jgi:hypothetical protein